MSERRLTSPVRLFAPAKVNLGLEVISRRNDGYHEVSTVMETVSIFDVIEILPAEALLVTSAQGVPDERDLVTLGLKRLAECTGIRPAVHVRVTKNIPIAAGLGGGSSDVGTVLGALQHLLNISAEDVYAVAASLGSDVPFFLHGGVALATGTGTTIKPVSVDTRRWYVIAVPELDIPSKTAALYGSLGSDDFTDGSRVSEIMSCLRSGHDIEPGYISNAFQRPLMEYEPVRRAASALQEAGARHVFPSGAGPTLCALCRTFDEARQIASRLPDAAGSVHVATSVRPEVNLDRIAVARS